MKYRLKYISHKMLILLVIVSWGITFGVCMADGSRRIQYEKDRRKWAKEKQILVDKLVQTEYYQMLYEKIRKS